MALLCPFCKHSDFAIFYLRKCLRMLKTYFRDKYFSVPSWHIISLKLWSQNQLDTELITYFQFIIYENSSEQTRYPLLYSIWCLYSIAMLQWFQKRCTQVFIALSNILKYYISTCLVAMDIAMGLLNKSAEASVLTYWNSLCNWNSTKKWKSSVV